MKKVLAMIFLSTCFGCFATKDGDGLTFFERVRCLFSPTCSSQRLITSEKAPAEEGVGDEFDAGARLAQISWLQRRIDDLEDPEKLETTALCGEDEMDEPENLKARLALLIRERRDSV